MKPRASSICAYALNFILPIAILVVSCIWSDIYPFGSRSFLTEDLKYQYVDFFTWFQNVLSGNESLFYSTSQALGNNTWGLYSYYLGSPLNFLIALFPEGAITEFVFFVTAIKLGIIQACLVFFIRRRFNLPYVWCTLLAIGFTWSSWTATQMRNPEWLDVLACLPLAALGTYALVRHGRWKMLLFSVAMAVICCWYTAYMLILFLCIYFIFESWMARYGSEKAKSRSRRMPTAMASHISSGGSFFRSAVQFVVVLIGALTLSAFTFVPTVLAMSQDVSPTLAVSDDSSSLISSTVAFFSSHSVHAIAAVVLLAVLVVVAVILARTRHISSTTKYVIFIILCLAASLAIVTIVCRSEPSLWIKPTCRISNFIKGLLPGGWILDDVPQLYSGVLILVLSIAFFATRRIPLGVKAAALAIVCGLFLSVFFYPLYVAWCGFKTPNGFFCRNSFFALFFMFWMASYFVHAHLASFEGVRVCWRNVIFVVLTAIVAVDVFVSVHQEWKQLYNSYPQEVHEEYVSEAKSEIAALNALDDGHYRVAKTYTRAEMAALNEGMSMGYDELSSYSSAHDGNAIAFLNNLGYSRIGEFSTRYAYPLLSSDALLGVSYAFTTFDPAGYLCVDDETNSRDAKLYENPYALSLGYMVSSDSEYITFEGAGDPFQKQNIVFNGLIGKDANPYVECSSQETSVSESIIEYEVEVPANSIGYAYVLDAGGSSVYLLVDDQAPFKENARFQDAIYGISNIADEAQTIKVYLAATEMGYSDETGAKLSPDARCIFYALDMERFESAIEDLAQSQMSFDVFSGEGISGNIVVQNDDYEVLMVSIPNSSGWDVKVDGQVVDTIDIVYGALTGIPLSKGEHYVEMSFVPPGLAVGIIISFITLAGIVIICFISHRRIRKKTREFQVTSRSRRRQ